MLLLSAFNIFWNSTEVFYAGFAQFLLFTATWMYSVLKSDVTVIDFAWGMSFTLQAAIYYMKTSGTLWYQNLFSGLVALHGFRLAQFLARRMAGQPEDKRMHDLRLKIGSQFWWMSYFIVFLPQMFISLIIGLSIYVFDASKSAPACNLRYSLGIIMMLAGFAIQGIADEQLLAFKRDSRNKGKILTSGLWKYSRHPNYFGDTLFWWGVYVVNLSINIPIAIFAPLLMNLMLRYGTGVPLTEWYMKQDYKGRFEDYERTTSPFIPWFPIETAGK